MISYIHSRANVRQNKFRYRLLNYNSLLGTVWKTNSTGSTNAMSEHSETQLKVIAKGKYSYMNKCHLASINNKNFKEQIILILIIIETITAGKATTMKEVTTDVSGIHI